MSVARQVFIVAIAATLTQLPVAGLSDVVVKDQVWTDLIGRPGIECRPSDNGKKIHEETFGNKYKLELWCDKGFFQLKVILPNGKVGYLGKCPYPFGQNLPLKLVKGDIIIFTEGFMSGRPIKVPRELKRTTYSSFDAPRPPSPIPPAGTAWQERTDSEWEYDTAKPKKLKKAATRHQGRWLPPKAPGKPPRYRVKDVKKIKPKLVNLPRTPAQLSIAGHILPGPTGECFVAVPEYRFVTPFPVPASIDGEDQTIVVRAPGDENKIVVKRIAATAGVLFMYDIDLPEEAADHVRYRLLDGPAGMSVGERDGTIRWTPGVGQSGERHEVVIAYGFTGQSGHVAEFTLPVLPPGTFPIDIVFERVFDAVEVVLAEGSVQDVKAHPEGGLLIHVSTEARATLEVAIPREVLDHQVDGVDVDFRVLVNDAPAEFEELENFPGVRTLRIYVPAGERSEVSVWGKWHGAN